MRALLVIVLLAALAAGLWFAVGRDRQPAVVTGPDGTPARSLVVLPGAEGAARNLITVHEPRDGASVPLASLDEVTFRWGAVEGARAYMFVANNEFGGMIWRTNTRDTVLTLPEKVLGTLVAGERLKWIVQVPGLSASSDLHRLELE